VRCFLYYRANDPWYDGAGVVYYLPPNKRGASMSIWVVPGTGFGES